MSGCNRKVLVVVVTFNPEWVVLFDRLIRILSEFDVFISDNSIDQEGAEHLAGFASFKFFDRLHYYHNGGNVGVAAAQNKGICYAEKNSYQYIVFIDDDSDFSADQIYLLLEGLEYLERSGTLVAALCAKPEQTGGLDNDFIFKECQKYTLTKNLMSSGSMCNVSVFKHVGYFDEGLFIDYVDYEWGWRAQSLGYCVLIDSAVIFPHSLGEGKVNLIFLKLGIPSPIRHFYQTRNLIKMLKLKYVPLKWKIAQLLLLIVRFFVFGFFYTGSSGRRKNFIRGFLAGIKG